MVSTEAAGITAIMNTVETAPNAEAIGLPANITKSVAPP
jgi:hypothetical protein